MSAQRIPRHNRVVYGAASAALLAVTIALATFYALYVTGWRDRLVDRLTEATARMRNQMEKSATRHPEVSRQLAPLHDTVVLYAPGMPIDDKPIKDIVKSFREWADQQTQGAKGIDAGNPASYDSLEVHIKDALVCESEVAHNLTLLSVVRRLTGALESCSFLVVGWLIVLVLTLVVAFVSGLGFLPDTFGLPLLAVPFWLFAVGCFALVKDVHSIFTILQIQEIAFDTAWADGSESRGN